MPKNFLPLKTSFSDLRYYMGHFWGILNLGHWDLPFDRVQGGESFDFAQDREPVERRVEPFEIGFLVLGIFMILIKQLTFLNSVNYLFKRRTPDNHARSIAKAKLLLY